VATLAMCGPSCALTYLVARAWQRFEHAPWRRLVEAGLAPITVGLVIAAGYLLARPPGASWASYAVTAGTTALVLWTRVHPLWLLAAAGALGLAGLV
jgi:chromate transporter